MTVALDVGIPRALATEIVQQYGDVLRVGRVNVNGSEVCWSTSGSTASQLNAFSGAFYGSLRKLPESKGLDDATLYQAIYWFCKGVSINYALCEVLDVVKDKVGQQCSITTSGQKGRTVVDYGVVMKQDHTVRVYVSWREKGNIIHCDPKTAKKKVKGTLSSLETEFPLPPDPCFTPSYSVHMKLKRSYKQKLISKVTSLARKPKPRVSPQIFLESPLHSSSFTSEGSLAMEGSLTGCSTEAPSSEVSLDGDCWGRSGSVGLRSWAPSSEISLDGECSARTSSAGLRSWDCSDSESEEESEHQREVSSPLHFRARSVIAVPSKEAAGFLRDSTRASQFFKDLRCL